MTTARSGLSPNGIVYNISYVVLIIFFCYFYTAISFNPRDVAENLQKYGVTIPGYSQGKRTEEYIDRILTRVTLAGAIMLSVVAGTNSRRTMSLRLTSRGLGSSRVDGSGMH